MQYRVQKIISITILSTFLSIYTPQGHSKSSENPENPENKVAVRSKVNRKFIKIREKPPTKGKVCRIETKKFGVFKAEGNSYEEAFSIGVEICFQKLNNNYINILKKYPGMEEQISFIRTCTNIECYQSLSQKRFSVRRRSTKR